MSACPFCDYTGRDDHVKRHMKSRHLLPDVYDVPLPNGCIFKPSSRKPYVLSSLKEEGSTRSVGVCMRCYDIIPHTPGSSRAIYNSHACKLPRGATSLPMPDMSFLATVAPPPPPTVTVSTEINWDAVLKDIMTDAKVKALIDKKMEKETTVAEEDDDEDEPHVEPEKSTRDIIIEVIKTDAILRRCNRLETQNHHIGQLNSQLENTVESLERERRLAAEHLELLKHSLCDQLAAARAEIERLKRRLSPPPTVEVIEHSN